MAPSPIGPRLEKLLDERDHLRIQISIALDDEAGEPERVAELRRRLLLLEEDIRNHWSQSQLRGARSG
jgi:hypothetical protein